MFDELLASIMPAPAMVFGLLLRLIGLAYAFALGMLVSQADYLAGHRGIQSSQRKFEQVRRDFDTKKRFLLFPSYMNFLVDLSPQMYDLAQKALLVVGASAGILVFWGGVPAIGLTSPICLFVAWSIYVSMSNTIQLVIYPWDYLLMEIGFISLFLPALHPLTTSTGMTSAPVPLLAFYVRFLLFRLMFGFGKMKFLGASWKEFSYLKGFSINMPLPTIIGWYMHSFPLWFHKIGLALFFIAEIIVPFGFIFASGSIRILCGIITIGLQLNIQLTGNFGFFNMLSAILCIGCLDGSSELLRDFNLSEQLSAAPFTHVLIGGIFLPLSFFFLIFNSWCTMSFMYWPSLNLPETGVGKFLRNISNWHFIAAYGIFWHQSSPPIRWVPIIEGTTSEVDDDDTDDNESASKKSVVWEPYVYKYMSVSPTRRPPFVAPYHFRFDQAIFYDSIGMTPDTLFTSLSSGNCYDYRGSNGTNLERVAQSLLLDQQPGNPIEDLFMYNPFPSATRPVKSIRISLYLYQPTTVEEQQRTGEYWRIKYAGEQVRGTWTKKKLLRSHVSQFNTSEASKVKSPSTTASVTPSLSEDKQVDLYYQCAEPSLWHPEHYLWQTRTNLFQQMTEQFEKKIANQKPSKNAAKELDAILSVGLVEGKEFGWKSSLNEKLWGQFLPKIKSKLFDRLIRTTQAVQQHTAGNTSCGCTCLTCSVHEAWTKHDKKAEQQPVVDWGREIQSLRQELVDAPASGASMCTPSEFYYLQILIHRAALLLTSRVLKAGGDLYQNPHPSEKRIQDEAIEAQRKLMEQTHAEQTHNCAQKCKCGHSSSSNKSRCSTPAPSFELNYGFLPAVTSGPRAKEGYNATHLKLPSFFHLHLFCMHALLSCDDEQAFVELLINPSKLLSLQQTFTLSSGMLLTTLFQLDLMVFHARKARLTNCITFPAQRETDGLLPGFLQIYFDFLPWQFVEKDASLHLPNPVKRPQKSDEVWSVSMDNMEEPKVNLYYDEKTKSTQRSKNKGTRKQ